MWGGFSTAPLFLFPRAEKAGDIPCKVTLTRLSEIDQLLEKAEATFDFQQRKEIYVQIQKKLHNNPPGIFLFWKDRMMIVDKRFRGIEPGVFRTVDNLIVWYVPKKEQKRTN